MRRTCKLILAALGCLVAFVGMSATPAAADPAKANGQILFARHDPLLDDTVLYTVNPDGSHERQVLSRAQCSRWSPGGARIATCGFPPNDATVIVDPDDGSFRRLPMPTPDTLFTACPVWAPNAARLACESFGKKDKRLNGIYTIRSSDGAGLTRMTSNPLGGGDMPGDYSPNGKRLVFARSEKREKPVGLYVVNVRDRRLRRITPRGTIFTSAGDWSPQGNSIVFSRRRRADTLSSLWVVQSDGGGLREIVVEGQPACGGPSSDPASRGCFNPRWSPDGKKIVFAVFTKAAGENIYTANADGTGLTQVTHGADDESPDWGTHPLIG